MPFLALPNEIITSIAEYLPPPSICHLILANHRLHAVLTPYFYYKIISHPPTSSLAIHTAAGNNQPASLLALISHGASLQATTPSGLSLIHTASISGHKNILSVLLEKDPAMINLKVPRTAATPLHLAIKGNHLEATEFLLSKGGDVSLVDSLGNSAVHHAIESTDQQVLEQILAYTSSTSPTTIDLENSSYQTPLSVAATQGNATAVRKLLHHDADLNQQNRYGYTALHRAARDGHHKVVEILIRAGANLFLVDEIGQSAIFFGVVSGKPHVVDLLWEAIQQRVEGDVDALENEKLKLQYILEDSRRRNEFKGNMFE